MDIPMKNIQRFASDALDHHHGKLNDFGAGLDLPILDARGLEVEHQKVLQFGGSVISLHNL